jgi:S1-C subfamily serine protease
MSVPAERLQAIFGDLVKGRPTGPSRPWLGILSQQIEDVVVVVGVSDGSPSLRAGLRQGDVVVAVNGERVNDLAGLYRRLWALGPAGVVVPLTLRRGGDVFEVEVRSADRNQLLKKPRYN